MTIPKFNLRLGSEQYLKLSGKRYINNCIPDTFNCRLSLRCGPLQASGSGDFTKVELYRFVTSVLEIVKTRRGMSVLSPSKVGSFTIAIEVANTGKLVTDVRIKTLTSHAMDAMGWNTHARFETNWEHFYNPVDVECLGVPVLGGLPGHIPAIDGRTKRRTGVADDA